MTGVRKVWDNGAESPYPAADLADIEVLKRQTGAIRVVAIRWNCGGQVFETAYHLSVLQDRTGYVHCEGDGPDGKALVVVNSDGTQRLRIGVPRVNDQSKPDEGYLVLPPSSASFGGINWGCEGNDGHTDYLFEFDWNTGALLRYARPTRTW